MKFPSSIRNDRTSISSRKWFFLRKGIKLLYYLNHRFKSIQVFFINLKRSRSWIYLLSRINWKWVLYLPQIVRQLLKLTVSWTFIVTLLITKFTNKIVCWRFQLSQMKMSIYITIGKWNEAIYEDWVLHVRFLNVGKGRFTTTAKSA